MCNSKEDYDIISKYVQESYTNEHALYLLFDNLLKGNTDHLATILDRISKIDTSIINEIKKKRGAK